MGQGACVRAAKLSHMKRISAERKRHVFDTRSHCGILQRRALSLYFLQPRFCIGVKPPFVIKTKWFGPVCMTFSFVCVFLGRPLKVGQIMHTAITVWIKAFWEGSRWAWKSGFHQPIEEGKDFLNGEGFFFLLSNWCQGGRVEWWYKSLSPEG